ncbi:MAG TPA: hypothetical protein VNM22_08325 [Candidatus Limnocylindrales bacterium]|nr:hypothetical protein [Candidatus Limnocylindrales bacterium]
MFSYLAYGLTVHSTLSLPELVPGEAEADVMVRLEKVAYGLPEPVDGRSHFWMTDEGIYLFYEEAGTFLIRGGREILIDPVPGVEERVLRLFILGPALRVLLHQRGLLVFHASAVSMNGAAIAFLGGPGWGKSTTVAALYARGHGVVADDITAVEVAKDHPLVFPGFPQLKLWPEAVTALGEDPGMLYSLHPHLEKRGKRITKGFSPHPLPLRCIYVLAEGQIPEIESIQPQETLIELIRHFYGIKLLRSSEVSSHFLRCASLAKKVAIRRLKRPRSLSSLFNVVQMVEEDLVRNFQ